MRNANGHATIGEKELAQMNASADATLLFGADDWDDAAGAVDIECARLCESLALAADTGFD